MLPPGDTRARRGGVTRGLRAVGIGWLIGVAVVAVLLLWGSGLDEALWS